MYKDFRVGLVIPAYNEELLIGKTITTLPDFVDRIVVVDDGSTDATSEKVRTLAHPLVTLLRNEENRGIGASVVRGIKELLGCEINIICLMAGDAQCDPACLTPMLDILTQGEADCAKANRFLRARELRAMPLRRRFGNLLLSLLTKFSTGYYSLFDSQNGFSATRADVLRRLDLDSISPRYEFENSFWLQLYYARARIRDVPAPAIYGEETSTIRFSEFVRRTSRVLIAGFFQRLLRTYVYSLHPLIVFGVLGLLLLAFGTGFSIWVTVIAIGQDTPSTGTVMLAVLPLLVGLQLLLAAFVMDVVNEPR